MGLEQRVDTLETKQEHTNEQLERIEGELSDFRQETRERFDDHDNRFDRIDKRLDDHDKRFDQMQAFNQQTQDMVRAIYFAVKHEKPPG